MPRLCRPVVGTKAQTTHLHALQAVTGLCHFQFQDNGSGQCFLLLGRSASSIGGRTCHGLALSVLHASCRLSQFSAIVIFREDGSRPTLLAPRVVGNEQALGDADARSLACLLLLRHIQVLQRKGLPVDAGGCWKGRLWLICCCCPQGSRQRQVVSLLWHKPPWHVAARHCCYESIALPSQGSAVLCARLLGFRQQPDHQVFPSKWLQLSRPPAPCTSNSH